MMALSFATATFIVMVVVVIVLLAVVNFWRGELGRAQRERNLGGKTEKSP